MLTTLCAILAAYAAIATFGWLVAAYRLARAERRLEAEAQTKRFWAGTMSQLLSINDPTEPAPR